MRPALLVVLAACGGASARTTIPIGLTLDGEATASTARLSLDAALARRDELRADNPPPGIQAGERAWFFRAYDDDELVFLEGQLHAVRRPTSRRNAPVGTTSIAV